MVLSMLLRKNHLLRCWGWPSLLNWIGAPTLSPLLKLPPKKLELWLVLWSLFLLRLLCVSINPLYAHVLEYCCHVWAGAPSCYMEMLDKLQKTNLQDCWSFTCCFSWTLDSPSKCGQLKSSIGIALVDNFQNWLNWFHFLFLAGGLLVVW